VFQNAITALQIDGRYWSKNDQLKACIKKKCDALQVILQETAEVATLECLEWVMS